MKTTISSKTKKATISTDGPFTVIGEKINPTGRKKLAAALQEENFDYVRDLAKKQIEAGADILDVNVGMAGTDDEVFLPKIVKILVEEFDIPLCLDTPNPKALAAALPLVQGRALVNSVNGEEKSLEAVLPLVREHGAAVIGLTIGAGATCAITDPMKYSLAIKAIDLLRGRDGYGMRYLKYYRAHAPEKELSKP
jgi:5-methyltetrahydrofolate--homocysteine methyltransferase